MDRMSATYLVALIAIGLAVGVGCNRITELGGRSGGGTTDDGGADLDTDSDADGDAGAGAEGGVDERASCDYRGETHRYLERFEGKGGVTCTCMPYGSVACATRSCGGGLDAGSPDAGGPDAGAVGWCDYYGICLAVGESTDSSDGCNEVTCHEGGLGTTTISCAPIEGRCLYNSKRYTVGEEFPRTDGCNICTCWKGGGTTCTTTWECQTIQ